MSRGRRARLAALAGAAALGTLLAGPPGLVGQEPDAAEEEEITIDADSLSYDQRLDSIEASGDVLIRRGDTTLRADDVRFNRRTSEAAALGDAVLTSPDAEIRATSMYLDLEHETGELRDADIYSDRLGFSLSGKRIEKGKGHTYRIEDGRFTTCNCAEGPPSWSIAGDALDVELDGYGHLEGGSFNILDVPVLWLPRAAFPVFRERQTGFLFPRIGISNRRGFQILQPFYWDISKSQDATVSFDLETSLRVGLVGEYRYAFSRTTEGEFQVGYFREAFGGRDTADIRVPPGADTNVPDNRWGVIGDHAQTIGSTEAFAHLLLVGDDLFLREMNTFATTEREEVDLRTRPFTESSVGFLHEWRRAVVQAQAIYYQDLVGPEVLLASTPVVSPTPQPTPQFVQRESLVIQRAPEALFAAQKQLGWGLMAALTGSTTNFVRGRGLAGFRGDLRPAALLRLPLGRSVVGTVNAAFRETAYGLTENRMAGGFTGQDLNQPEIVLPSSSSREIVELRGDLSTELARVYDFQHFGLDKLKHTIEPQLEYFYVPPVDQDELPIFDGIDRINKRSLFTYGVVTRLLGRRRLAPGVARAGGDVFELTRLSIAQSYDVNRDIPPTQLIIPDDPQPLVAGDHFSDIDVSLRIDPGTIAAVRTFATYDTSEGNLSSATVGVRLREPIRALDPAVQPRLLTRASLAVDYRFITDSILQLLDSSLALPLTDRLAVLYAMRYDIDANTFLENYIGVRIISSCDCWALNLGVIDTRNPDEIQVQAQFTLAGIGSSTLGGLGSF